MKKIIKEYVIITIGLLLVAIGTYYFLVISNLAAGGVSGLAMVINKFYPALSVGVMMLVMNVVLFIVAIIVIGPHFGGKTIYSSFGLSGMIWFFEKFMPLHKPLTNDLFLQLFYGIMLSSIGMAIVFNQNASTGGTDIIGKILNKFFHIDLGKAQLIVDATVTLLALFAFGPTIGMYAILGVIMNGFMIDWIIEGLNISKHVTVISSDGQKIKDFIVNELGRGVTIYEAVGGYTGDEKEVITTILSRKEFIRLKIFIKDVDDKAFITVSNVHEVFGEGFKQFD